MSFGLWKYAKESKLWVNASKVFENDTRKNEVIIKRYESHIELMLIMLTVYETGS